MIYRRGKSKHLKLGPNSVFWVEERPIKDGLDSQGKGYTLNPTDCVAGITFGGAGKIWL